MARGHTNGPRPVRLPAGWLEDVDDPTPPAGGTSWYRGAETSPLPARAASGRAGRRPASGVGDWWRLTASGSPTSARGAFPS